MRTPGFPPVIYFGGGRGKEREAVRRLGVAGYLERKVSHDAFAVMLGPTFVTRAAVSRSTDSLFVGDFRTGIKPLIKRLHVSAQAWPK